MNTPSPLVPQGSFLEHQKSRGKSNLIIAFFTILVIHLVLFGGLLIQGCRREKPEPAATGTTNVPPIEATNYYAATHLPGQGTNIISETPGGVAHRTNLVQAQTEMAGAAREYTVVKGDSLYKIASDHGISLDALRKANPNVEPRKMKVGQVLQIPAAPPATATAPANAERPIEGAEQTYTVKAGDTLTKIAKIHKTTIEALKEANNLKTDRLKVGQKLKIPPPKTTNAPANPASGPTSGAPRGAQLADTNPVWTAVIGRC